ncbi:MAG: tetratricopeptide repeat protein [Alphaproteobacteria bacterium]|nr:tetratricopeptide repeat protein [Alphaproteobacteria bacterium]
MPDPRLPDLDPKAQRGTALADVRASAGASGRLPRLQRLAVVGLLVAMLLVWISPALARDRAVAAPPGVAVAPPSPAALALLDAAIAQGRLADARALLAPLWATDSEEVALRAAELALASGSLAEAAEGFGQLGTGPLAARGLQGLGITRLKQGRLADAMAALDAAVALDAGLSRAWNARAVVADRQKDWATADVAYARAIAAAPADAAVLANRGWSLLLRGRHVAAERDLERALALAPADRVVQTNLALARAMQGRYQEAFRHSSRASLAGDLNSVGYAAMARGDLAVAEAYFNRALSLNPQFDRAAWANLQYLAELKGRPQP